MYELSRENYYSWYLIEAKSVSVHRLVSNLEKSIMCKYADRKPKCSGYEDF